MDLNSQKAIQPLIQGSLKGKRRAQEKLFKACFSYGMSVCLRYTDHHTQAEEALSEGFAKMFAQLHRYDPSRSFKGWLRRVLINTSIDLHRREKPHRYQVEIDDTTPVGFAPCILDEINAEAIKMLIAQLPPAYRNIFNLYVVEGYNHREIADMLDISEGTSKSNLSKARVKLQKLIQEHSQESRYHGA